MRSGEGSKAGNDPALCICAGFHGASGFSILHLLSVEMAELMLRRLRRRPVQPPIRH